MPRRNCTLNSPSNRESPNWEGNRKGIQYKYDYFVALVMLSWHTDVFKTCEAQSWTFWGFEGALRTITSLTFDPIWHGENWPSTWFFGIYCEWNSKIQSGLVHSLAIFQQRGLLSCWLLALRNRGVVSGESSGPLEGPPVQKSLPNSSFICNKRSPFFFFSFGLATQHVGS